MKDNTEGPKIRKVLGVRIKEKALKPFNQRISQELRDKIEENTKINNKYIKFYSTVDTRDDKFLVRNIMGMLYKRKGFNK